METLPYIAVSEEDYQKYLALMYSTVAASEPQWFYFDRLVSAAGLVA